MLTSPARENKNRKKNKNHKNRAAVVCRRALPTTVAVVLHPLPASSHRCRHRPLPTPTTVGLLPPRRPCSSRHRSWIRANPGGGQPSPPDLRRGRPAARRPPPPPDLGGDGRRCRICAGDGRRPIVRHRSPHAAFIALPSAAACAVLCHRRPTPPSSPSPRPPRASASTADAPHRLHHPSAGCPARRPLPPSPLVAFAALPPAAVTLPTRRV